MATKLTLMEMRFSKSLTNTSYIKQSDTKSSSLALIRSLRMNDSAYSLRNAERDDMMLRMLKNAWISWWFLRASERWDLPKSPPPDGKVIMWVCRRRHFDFQKKNTTAAPGPSLPHHIRKKEICRPLPFHTAPHYQEEMHGDSTVLWKIWRKKDDYVHRTPNWRVSDSPRKNEDRKPLKFEKPTHTSLFTKRKLKIRLFPPPFFLFPEWSGIVFITLPSFIYI